MDKLKDFLYYNPNLIIEISNHLDLRSSDKYSSNPSQSRARSIADYLIEKGIAKERLFPKGYGKVKPRVIYKDMVMDSVIFPAGTRLDEKYIEKLKTNKEKEVAHSLNRRTEISILSTEYVDTTKLTLSLTSSILLTKSDIFQKSQTTPDSSSFWELNKIITHFKNYPNYHFEIIATSDEAGDMLPGQGKARAIAVADYFVKNGIDPARITAVGYDIWFRQNEKSASLNRKVRIKIIIE